jgi:orotate phosphoribosyltransferase-like protein
MSKLRETLEEASIHGSYSLAFANILTRQEDIVDEVERLGSEINIAIGQGLMKHTGKGNILVQLVNIRRDFKKVTDQIENILKSTRKLK